MTIEREVTPFLSLTFAFLLFPYRLFRRLKWFGQQNFRTDARRNVFVAEDTIPARVPPR
jgi:hypothetical protein